MKKFLAFLLLATALLCSCAKQTDYVDDYSVKALAQKGMVALTEQKEFTSAEKGYLDDWFIAPDYIRDSVIYFATDANNHDQFGIYHVTDGNAKAMAVLLADYLDDCYENYNSMYNPEELPKIRDAQVKVYGNYVVYVVFDEADRTAFLSAVENALTA